MLAMPVENVLRAVAFYKTVWMHTVSIHAVLYKVLLDPV